MELTYVGELSPIDVEKLNTKQALTALFNGVVQTHACLEKHIAEQTLANLDATEKRHEMQTQLLDVRSAALDVKSEVGALAIALGVRKAGEGEAVPPKAKTVLPLVEHIKVLGVVGGSLAGVGALLKLLHAIWPSLEAYLLSVAK